MTIIGSSGADSSSTSFASEIDSVAPNLATQPIFEEMSGGDEFGYSSAIELDGKSRSYSSSSHSTRSVEGSKNFDHAISSASPLMEVDST